MLSLTEAEAEASLILEFCLGRSRTWLELNAAKLVTEAEEQALSTLISKRLERVPLQHLTRQAHFYGLRFEVSNAVLIPRPETEFLVDKALEELQNKKEPKILELGTGSGCISVALAKKLALNSPQIFATDISAEALQIAQSNAAFHEVQKYIQFIQADLVAPKQLTAEYDLLISNPPYISPSEFEALEEEVKKEPSLALVGENNPDGLTYYRRIATLPLRSSAVLLELDHGRAPEIKEIFEESGRFKELRLWTDLNGFWRYLSGHL